MPSAASDRSASSKQRVRAVAKPDLPGAERPSAQRRSGWGRMAVRRRSRKLMKCLARQSWHATASEVSFVTAARRAATVWADWMAAIWLTAHSLLRRGESEENRALCLDAFGVGEGDRGEHEVGAGRGRDAVDRQLGGEVVALQHLVVPALDRDDQHVGELVALEVGEGDAGALEPQVLQDVGLQALAEGDVGELVEADVELDCVEMAGVVDVAALGDREAALGADEAGVLALGGGGALVLEVRQLGRLQVLGVLAVGLQDVVDELLGDVGRQDHLRLRDDVVLVRGGEMGRNLGSFNFGVGTYCESGRAHGSTFQGLRITSRGLDLYAAVLVCIWLAQSGMPSCRVMRYIMVSSSGPGLRPELCWRKRLSQMMMSPIDHCTSRTKRSLSAKSKISRRRAADSSSERFAMPIVKPRLP